MTKNVQEQVGETKKWLSPCYFGGYDQVNQFAGRFANQFNRNPLPNDLGPDAVLYGSIRNGELPQQGIGYGGRWHRVGLL